MRMNLSPGHFVKFKQSEKHESVFDSAQLVTVLSSDWWLITG